MTDEVYWYLTIVWFLPSQLDSRLSLFGSCYLKINHPLFRHIVLCINFGRYHNASAKCTDWISSFPTRSAIVRAS